MALAEYVVGRPPRNPLERLLFDAARALWRVPRQNVWTVEEYRRQLVAAGFVHPTLDCVGVLMFPGFYAEQRRPAFRGEMERLQGRLLARAGAVVGFAANWAYDAGLVDYVLVRAETPA